MKNAKILVVEDEQDISNLLKAGLSSQGHEVLVIHDGSEAINFIQTDESATVDLFILDRMLPGKEGLDICKFLRSYKVTKSKPILMLTALTRPEQIVTGLDAGADDYITKPFDISVLMARVRSLLRRAQVLSDREEPNSDTDILEIKTIKIDKNKYKAYRENKELELTLSEYKLLLAFIEQPGKVLTRNQLVEYIQEGPVHVTQRTIDTHIFGLRKKLGECSNMIETIRGIGYRLINEN